MKQLLPLKGKAILLSCCFLFISCEEIDQIYVGIKEFEKEVNTATSWDPYSDIRNAYTSNHSAYNQLATVTYNVPRSSKGKGVIRLQNGKMAPALSSSSFRGYDVGSTVRIKELSANYGYFIVTAP